MGKIAFDPLECRGVTEPLDEVEVWRDIENGNEMHDQNEKLKAVASIVL